MIVADAPAAHSMDADWYAVDADGNVARMFSGEEGAVPHDAHREYWEELYQRIAVARIDALVPPGPQSSPEVLQRALAGATDATEAGILRAIVGGDDSSRAIYGDYLEQRGRLPARAIYRFDGTVRELGVAQLPFEWSGVLRFADRDYLELFVAESYCEWTELDRQTGHVERLHDYVFLPYWDEGVITSAYVLDTPAPAPRDLGLYEYACPFVGDYDLRGEPAEPITLDQLPAVVRAQIGRLRVPIRFRGTRAVQPLRWFACHEWLR